MLIDIIAGAFKYTIAMDIFIFGIVLELLP